MKKIPRRPRPATVRTTFDLDYALHKRLQIAAVTEDVYMVDIAQQGIRNLLDALDNPDHDAAYDAAYEAGRRAAFAEAADAVRVLGEAAHPLVVAAPVEPAPVRFLPTRPPHTHAAVPTQAQSS